LSASEGIVDFRDHGGCVMNGIQDLLIRGSEKVIGHYRLLLTAR
jgi:hypothetical protein